MTETIDINSVSFHAAKRRSINKRVFSIAWRLCFGACYVSEFVFGHSNASRVFLILFFSMSVLDVIAKKRIFVNKFHIFFGLFIGVCLLNIVMGISINRSVSMSRIYSLGLNLVFLMFLSSMICYIGKRSFMLLLIRSTVIADIAFIIVSSILNGRIAVRGEANIANANTLAVMSSFCICIICIQKAKYKKHLSLNDLLCIGVFLFFTMLSGARKPLLVLIIAYVVYILFSDSKEKAKITLRLGLAALAVYAAIMYIPFLYDVIGNRVESMISFVSTGEGDASARTRSHLIETGWMYIKQRPFYGYGLDCFKLVKGSYGLYSHNNYIEMMFSIGLIGTIVYYSNHLMILIKSLKNRKKDPDCILAITLVASVLFVDYGLVSYYARGILIILCFCYLIARGGLKE